MSELIVLSTDIAEISEIEGMLRVVIGRNEPDDYGSHVIGETILVFTALAALKLSLAFQASSPVQLLKAVPE